MKKELEVFGGSSLEGFDPSKAALRVHSLEVMERVALRAKDVKAVERAVLGKLEAQRDFAAGYRAEFKHGNNQHSGLARSGDSYESYCARFGFALRTVQRWAERLLDSASFEVERHERLLKVWKILEMDQAANYSSESVEWYTPSQYVEAARACMGGIDLDPASSAKANETVKAKTFLTDGLDVPWNGRVFLNPPYGRTESGDSLASAFCNRAIAEFHAGRVDQAVLLVNSVHSQKWQAPLYAFPVCFVDHRIEFVSGDGTRNENPTFQNIFIYLGSGVSRFAGSFSQFGYVMGRLQ